MLDARESREKCGKVVDSQSTSHFQREREGEMVQIVGWETLVAVGCRSAAKRGLFAIISESFSASEGGILIWFVISTYEHMNQCLPKQEPFALERSSAARGGRVGQRSNTLLQHFDCTPQQVTADARRWGDGMWERWKLQTEKFGAPQHRFSYIL